MQTSTDSSRRFRTYAIAAVMGAFLFFVAAAMFSRTQRPSVQPGPVVADWRWLGLEVSTLTLAETEALKLPAGTQGVVVDGITGKGAAAQAGFQPDDVIVQMNDREIRSSAEFWAALTQTAPSAQLTFSVLRAGSTAQMTLVNQESSFSLA